MSNFPSDEERAANPFLTMDNVQLEIFRSWIDDRWTWDCEDETMRLLRTMIYEAERRQGQFRIYAAERIPSRRSIETIVADCIKTEKVTRGDSGPPEVNESLRLVAVHIGMPLEFFLGKQVVDMKRLCTRAGFEETP